MIKLRMLMMSHLSDAQELEGRAKDHRINFVKFLLSKHSDPTIDVDADREYKDFTDKHPNR